MRGRRSRRLDQGRGVAARSALRAAALLRGGIAASRVWRLIGAEPDAGPQLAGVSAAIEHGSTTAQALSSAATPEWRVLAAAWHIAEVSGAPLASTLDRLAAALTELERIAERRSVLLAGPRATIRLVVVLPLCSVLLGTALGFDPLVVLLSPGGMALAVSGVALLLLGARWASRLAERMAKTEWVAGLECELCWIALSAGATPNEALRRVADAVSDNRAEWVRLSTLTRDGAVHSVLRTSTAFGTPAGPLLLSEATAARSRAIASLEREAERLGVRVLVPLGVCVLPAFVLLGVVPMLIAVVTPLT